MQEYHGISSSEFKVLDKRGGFDGKLEKLYDWNNDLGSVIAFLFRPPPAIDKTFPSDPHFCNNGLIDWIVLFRGNGKVFISKEYNITKKTTKQLILLIVLTVTYDYEPK